MGSLPSGINSSLLQGLCLEVSRCWGGRAPAVVTQLHPPDAPGPGPVARQAFLLAFPLSVEFWRCLPELPALIKPPFLRDIVYVCWSHRGICGHYFYFPKVNSGPQNEMPLVSFHRKVPRTSSGPFWIYIWSHDKVGGKKLEGMSEHKNRGKISGSLRHRSTNLQSLCRGQAPISMKEGFVVLYSSPNRSSRHFYSDKGHDGIEFGDPVLSNQVKRILVVTCLHGSQIPNLTKLCG